MSKKDEKKLEGLTDRLVKLIGKIYKMKQSLSKIETEADNLLRKLFGRKWP